MKKIIFYVKEYYKETFNLKLYAAIAILLAFLISANYTLNIEDNFIDAYHGTWYKGVLYALLTGGSYLITCLFIQLFTEKKDILEQKGFWYSLLLFYIIFGVYRGSYYAIRFVQDITIEADYYFYYKLVGNLEDIAFGVLPFVFIYFVYDRKKIDHCYGLNTQNANIKPYIIMLLIMCLPIYFASLTDGFMESYPKANKAHYLEFSNIHSISSWSSFLIFEFFYLTSFLAVEIMFRGFLIYRLEKYLGNYVVLPMMVAYAVIHFGKPLGETLGSIGGAYVLGILALKTKNIYGGIFIHIGVALLMEIFALLSF
jgi:membrane protease YdiL (CAAX protease family)